MAVLLGGGWKGDGPSWYRVELPARWLRAHGVDARTGYAEMTDQHIVGITAFSTQRGQHPSMVLAIAKMRSMGIRCVYEIDDDVWSMPSWNLLRNGFDQDCTNRMEGIMRSCDAVTVTTSRLASMCARRAGNQVFIVPNAIPLDLVPAEQERTKPGVRVGWWGSDTHSRDLERALPGLRRVLRERPNVTLVFMGAMPAEFEASPRVEYHEWVDPDVYYEALRRLEIDVLVAPLEEHRFNYAKSNVKILEGAALGVAIVASDVGPYQEIRNGETGFTVKANRPDLWASLLMDVTGDEGLRKKLGAAARAWVEAEYTMDQTGPKWAEALGVTI